MLRVLRFGLTSQKKLNSCNKNLYNNRIIKRTCFVKPNSSDSISTLNDKNIIINEIYIFISVCFTAFLLSELYYLIKEDEQTEKIKLEEE